MGRKWDAKVVRGWPENGGSDTLVPPATQSAVLLTQQLPSERAVVFLALVAHPRSQAVGYLCPAGTMAPPALPLRRHFLWWRPGTESTMTAEHGWLVSDVRGTERERHRIMGLCALTMRPILRPNPPRQSHLARRMFAQPSPGLRWQNRSGLPSRPAAAQSGPHPPSHKLASSPCWQIS